MQMNEAEQKEFDRRIALLKEQMLIVLIKRVVGPDGKISIDVTEIDDTSQDLLMMQADPNGKQFHFALTKKT